MPLIPARWAVVATIAAVQLEVPEDFGLTSAAAIAALLFSRRQRALLTPA